MEVIQSSTTVLHLYKMREEEHNSSRAHPRSNLTTFDLSTLVLTTPDPCSEDDCNEYTLAWGWHVLFYMLFAVVFVVGAVGNLGEISFLLCL